MKNIIFKNRKSFGIDQLAIVLYLILGFENYGNAQTNTEVRYQQGYFKSNGTYVQPHFKTTKNSTNHDNYSTEENTNDYSQEKGTRARDYSTDAYNYGTGQTIQTGERGGQYYYNSKGNKTYVPKR